jgi:DNA-directed DNA polymerase III PolC
MMEGVSSLEQLCHAAKQYGMDALALTDTNGLYGAIRFIEVAKQYGLKPILGAELRQGVRRAVLLVKHPEGYANLCRLLSLLHSGESCDVINAVAEHSFGLIVISDDVLALKAWKKHKLVDLYVELTPSAMMHQSLQFSRDFKLPVVATNRVRFVSPQQHVLHKVLRAIALNATLSTLPEEHCCADTNWFAPASFMAGQFPHVLEALDNTQRIAEMCRADWNFKDTVFPAFRQLSDVQAFMLLRDKTYDGAVWRYGAITRPVKDRIESELQIIRAKGFAHCFLVVEEIVQQAPRTCGRGSAAASIVSYCLGITHVDPIRHNLFFERFLNVGRHDPPDIDVDFAWDERDGVLDYVFAKYGATRVAMVANQNTLGLRAAIREVAKVHGIPLGEMNALMPNLERHPGFNRVSDSQSINAWAEVLCSSLHLAKPWPEIFTVAVQLQGRVRNLGLHCGGMVIVPDEIRKYVPVQIAAKGIPVIQWEKDQTEDSGLVKLDILGNRSLAVIRDALQAIAKNTGHVIDYATWDAINDDKTKALICCGETMGCFYVESPATRLLLKRLWKNMPTERKACADVFEYLVIVSSLIRSAANRYVREFVQRAHGKPYTSPHPLLDEVLNETHGIMVYQEDVTKVAMVLADFPIEDADQLRKVMSKKHKQKQLQDYKVQFYRGAAAKHVSKSKIDAIWGMIMSFVGYSFCKPHSASYAQVSFKSAYLRAHYPAEFMASVISNQGGFYSTSAYLSEAKRMGLTVQPPDINASEWAYVGNGQAMRVGFMQIKGLKKEFIDATIEERNANGPYASLREFLERVDAESAQTRLLIKAGCLDSISGEVTRPGLLWRLYAREGLFPSKKGRQPSLYASSLTPYSACSSSDAPRFTFHASRALPIPPDYSGNQKIKNEIELFGFPLSKHPLELYQEALKDYEFVSASEMHRYAGKQVRMVGWLITEKFAETNHGQPMEFTTFEDLTGLYDATFFPKVFQHYGHLLTGAMPYIVEGLIEEDLSECTLTVKKLAVVNYLVNREGQLSI